MARTGFRIAKYNLFADGKKYAAITSGVPVFEKVIDEKFAAEYNNAELYANDSLCESDYSFKKGTLSLTIADDNDAFLSKLFGDTATLEGKEYTKNVSDVAPYMGYGHIIPKMVAGTQCFKVEFFPKVKFTKVTADNKTAGDNVEFSTASVEAMVYPLATDELTGYKFGDWEKHETFATYEEAVAYLDGLLTPAV